MKFKFLLIALSLTSLNLVAQESIASMTGLEYGEHQVGFRFIETYDHSRQALKEQTNQTGRITPIYLWYPAKKESGEPLKVSDYIKFWSKETGYDIPLANAYESALKNYRTAFFFKTAAPHFKDIFNLHLNSSAIENGTFADGKHPLIILTHGAILTWHIVGEYLASHGFAVAFAPKAGSVSKFHEGGIEGVKDQQRDAEHIIDELSTNQHVDITQIGMIGFSFGSLPAVGLAAKHKSVKAVISLDGVLGDPVEGDLMYQMPYVSLQKYTTPTMHITGGYSFSTDRSRIDKMVFSNRYILEVRGMRHNDFMGQWIYDDSGINLSGEPNGDYKSGFKTTMSYAKAFLSAHLSGRNNDFNTLWKETVVENGPIVSKESLSAESKDYDYGTLVDLVFSGQNEALFEIYEKHKSLDIPPFAYSTFHDIGSIYYFRGQMKAANQWYQYFVESYPNAAKAHYLLGLTQRNLKNPDEARKSFEKARGLMSADLYHTPSQKEEYLKRITRIVGNLD